MLSYSFLSENVILADEFPTLVCWNKNEIGNSTLKVSRKSVACSACHNKRKVSYVCDNENRWRFSGSFLVSCTTH